MNNPIKRDVKFGVVEHSAGIRYVPEIKISTEVTFNYLKHSDQTRSRQIEIQNFYKVLIKELKKISPRNIIDVGCGEGFTLNRLQQDQVGEYYTGIDNHKTAVNLGNKLFPSINITTGDIYNLPYKDNSYDTVICTEVLEHLEYPELALNQLIRISNKYIVLSVPNEPFFSIRNMLKGKHIKRLGNTPGHLNQWSDLSFKHFLQSEDIQIVSTKRPFPFTLIIGIIPA